VEQQIILNVDDYPPGRYARTKVLRQAGFQVIEAQSGKESLAMATLHKPALILLDVNLPDMNGFEVCRRIREDPALSSLTILHISASAIMPQQQVRGLDSGADGYLVEPVESSVLIATVNAYLRMRRAEAALRRSNEGLEEFAFVISHDLQEPLRNISIYTELLAGHLKDHMDDNSLLYEGYIRTGVLRMQKLIHDLLQFSRVIHEGDEGSGVANLEVVSERVLDLMHNQMETYGVTITRDRLPVVRGDETLLEQVFRNLISNAIKYRKANEPPCIHISAKKNGRLWLIGVADNGIGFDPQFSERIFTLFQRLHGREYPGTGVGLAICKRVIEQAGGRIWAESSPGVGSTFYFTLSSDEPAGE
jgi:two-component system sensor histidine kinase/response regulator